MSADLVLTSFEEISKWAKVFVESKMFTDSSDLAKCIVKVQAGAEMGLKPFQSMNNLHIINGKICTSALVVGDMIKRSHRYTFRVLKIDNTGCIIRFFEKTGGKWDCIGDSEFTREHAVKAGTKNLEKFARNMFYARAITNGARWYTPDVFGGAIYTPDELDSTIEVDEEENVLISQFKAEPLGSKAEDMITDEQIRRIVERCDQIGYDRPEPEQLKTWTYLGGKAFWEYLVEETAKIKAKAAEAFTKAEEIDPHVDIKEADPYAELDSEKLARIRVKIADKLLGKKDADGNKILMPDMSKWTLADGEAYLHSLETPDLTLEEA